MCSGRTTNIYDIFHVWVIPSFFVLEKSTRKINLNSLRERDNRQHEVTVKARLNNKPYENRRCCFSRGPPQVSHLAAWKTISMGNQLSSKTVSLSTVNGSYQPPLSTVSFSKESPHSCLYPCMYNCMSLKPDCKDKRSPIKS